MGTRSFTLETLTEEEFDDFSGKHPDGNFPTCTYPNPEEKATLELGIKLCKELEAGIYRCGGGRRASCR